jgi:hypothetical protein
VVQELEVIGAAEVHPLVDVERDPPLAAAA